jgi:hypothetical protein
MEKAKTYSILGLLEPHVNQPVYQGSFAAPLGLPLICSAAHEASELLGQEVA